MGTSPEEVLRCLTVLELGPGASQEDVERAYKEMVQVWHPDRFSHNKVLRQKAEQKMREINLAHQVLQEYFKNPYKIPSVEENKGNTKNETAQTKTQHSSKPYESPSQRRQPEITPLSVLWVASGGLLIFLITLFFSLKTTPKVSNVSPNSNLMNLDALLRKQLADSVDVLRRRNASSEKQQREYYRWNPLLNTPKASSPNSIIVTSDESIYYKGLPDWSQHKPQISQNSKLHDTLHQLIQRQQLFQNKCVMSQIRQEAPSNFRPISNICDENSFTLMAKTLSLIWPQINQKNLSLFLYDDGANGERELFVGFDQINSGAPYYSLWLLTYDGRIYHPSFIDYFLGGTILDIKKLGSRKYLFLNAASCWACDSTIELIAYSFNMVKERPLLVSWIYNNQKQHSIEYAIPGHGHTVDADIETKIVDLNNLPGILQKFTIYQYESKTGPTTNEWWTWMPANDGFKGEMVKGDLPHLVATAWHRGIPLNPSVSR